MKQQLTHALFTKCYELLDARERNIKAYEIAFQQVIEDVTGDLWWEVTDCNIFMHLLEHKDPHKTVTEIINNLKEEYQ
jgi:hypothetical protein